MQELGNPITQTGSTTIFYGTSVGTWQPYQVPIGATLLSIYCLGSGGGGGNGRSDTTTDGYGNAGGGGAAQSRVLYITSSLPSLLFIQVGVGGAGGIGSSGDGGTNANGSAGGLSYVSTAAVSGTPSASLLVARSGAANAGGNSGIVGGTAGTINTNTGCLYHYSALCSPQFLSGIAGGGATVDASGSPVAPNLGQGSGGGGAACVNSIPAVTNGGNITAFTQTNDIFPQTLSGGAGNISGDNSLCNGISGFNSLCPLFFTGGSGGGSLANSVSDIPAGHGGQGGFGCGGGGGGGCNDSATPRGGNGGGGGDGLVIITAW